ncbi:MAG: hypothetical protein PUJ92_00835 [Bacilli bacterium]|nr:hypothetical protein [Bacilli bacterium]MDY5832919.1 hypothetical protein [Candidatus Onthovivens sp.]
MKICHLKIENSMINNNVKIENIDFENDIIFLNFASDCLFGCRCFIKENMKKYIFYSTSSNRYDVKNKVIIITKTSNLNEYKIEYHEQ